MSISIFLGFNAPQVLRIMGQHKASIGIVIDHDKNVGHELGKHPGIIELGKARRLPLLARPSRSELNTYLHMWGQHIAAAYVMYDAKDRWAQDPEFYADLKRNISDILSSIASTLRSAVVLAERTRISCYQNLPKVIYHPSIDLFKGMYNKRPVVVVSAGPSLEKNIDVLETMQENVIIVAVGTVYRALLQRGMRPDFFCTLDFHPLSAGYIKGLPPEANATLVALPGAATAAVDAWPGRVVFTGDSTLTAVLSRLRVNRSSLEGGGTVAHLAFSFARWLGADPVIFVGQDLSFKEDQTHFENVGLVGGKDYLEKLRLPEGAERIGPNLYEYRGSRVAPGLREAIDIDGNTVYTDMHMASYAVQFEEMFNRCDVRVINATEGGILRNHCEITPLYKLQKMYWAKIGRKQRTGRLKRHFKRWEVGLTREKVGKVLSKRRESAIEMGKELEVFDGLFQEIYDATDRGEDVPGLDEKVSKEFDAARKRYPDLMSEVARLCQAAEIRKNRVVSESAEDLARGENQKARYVRAGTNVDYLYATSKGAKLVAECCNVALERLDALDLGAIRGAWLEG